MAAGGPRAALERLFRFVAGDANWENLDQGLRERMSGNGQTLFGVDMGRLESYRPDDATLAAISAPVQVLVSEQSAPFFAEAAGWLAARLGVKLARTPCTHTPQFDHRWSSSEPSARSYGSSAPKRRPADLVGIHLNLLVTALRGDHPAESDAERATRDALTAFRASGSRYLVEQSTRPQTIGYALLDSPLALAAWMLDHDTDSYEKISRAFLGGKPSGNLTPDRIVDKITL
jgi:hypothetical protein